MLRTLGFSLTIFILFTGCNGGEKCCLDTQSQTTHSTISQNKISVEQTIPPLITASFSKKMPEAVITYKTTTCKTGEEISFDGYASKSSNSDEHPDIYEWISNDQVVGTDTNVTLPCDFEGKKEICLKVTDNNKLSDKRCLAYTVTDDSDDEDTIPPVPVITVKKHSQHHFGFNCSQSYDPDKIDTDHNVSNNGKIISSTWEIYKTENGIKLPLETQNVCKKCVSISDDLDLMEVTLIVTDDDNETASVTEVYTWDGQELIKEP